MPPRAYAVGYLRAYSAAVGLDADEVVLRFEEAVGPAEGGSRRERTGSARSLPLALVAVGLAAAAAIAWALLR